MKGRVLTLVIVVGILMLMTSCSEKTTEAKPEVAVPIFNPSGGTYTSPQEIEIICSTEGAVIRYTVDGTDPTPSATTYSAPVLISETAILKARAYKDGWQDSGIVTAEYVFEQEIEVHSIEFENIPESISLEEVLTLSVRVFDEELTPIKDGTPVSFTAGKGFFIEDNSVGYIVDGLASVQWNSGTIAGEVVFTAVAGDVNKQIISYIKAGSPAKINLFALYKIGDDWFDAAIDGIPEHLAGGLRIRAEVKDTFDNAAAAGIPIHFETDFGTIINIVDTDDNGVSLARFFPGVGTATVTITAATSDGTVEKSIVFTIYSDTLR